MAFAVAGNSALGDFFMRPHWFDKRAQAAQAAEQDAGRSTIGCNPKTLARTFKSSSQLDRTPKLS
jgi:hypothetical protein